MSESFDYYRDKLYTILIDAEYDSALNQQERDTLAGIRLIVLDLGEYVSETTSTVYGEAPYHIHIPRW